MDGICPSVSQGILPTPEIAASYQVGGQGNALTSAETMLNDKFRLNADYVVAPICPFWLYVKACCNEADDHDPRRSIQDLQISEC